MTRAGAMRHRVAFDAPVEVRTDTGGFSKTWQEQFFTRAGFQFLRGGEGVQAARLAGNQVIVATIRSHAAAKAVTPGYRMRDRRTGVVYNVRTVEPNKEKPEQYLDVMAESGVAT